MPASNTFDSCLNDHDDSLQQQLSVARTVLLQAVHLLDNYLTSDDQLSVSSQYLSGSTIGAHQPRCVENYQISCLPGKHLRHARDHFVLLVACMSQPPGLPVRNRTKCLITMRSPFLMNQLQSFRMWARVSTLLWPQGQAWLLWGKNLFLNYPIGAWFSITLWSAKSITR